MAQTLTSLSAPRPVLVTGTIRSGTTWVGHILGQAARTWVIDEPFNPDNQFQYGLQGLTRFQYLDQTCPSELPWQMLSALGLRFDEGDLSQRLARCPDVVDKLLLLRDYLSFPWKRAMGFRPVIKDPMALFSAPWIAETTGAKVIVMLRHPAAFVQSLERLGWGYDFEWFTSQPRLQPWLAEYWEQLEASHWQGPNALEQGILAWNLSHALIAKYQMLFPHWKFVRHEDLSRNPEGLFQELYDYAGLRWSPAIAEEVARSSARENPVEAPSGTIHALERNSQAHVFTWKKKLPAEWITRILRETQPWLSHFYPESEFLQP